MEVPNIWIVLIIFSICCCRLVSNREMQVNYRETQENEYTLMRHKAKVSDDHHFWRTSTDLGDLETFHNVLSNILIERVSGTPSNAKVRKYIVDFMKNLDWSVEEDTFDDNTPIGRIKFSNIIARLNPNANRFLTLACHYDSKLMENFVGATDSAVPCAIMMNVATTLHKYLLTRRNTDLSLQFVFFDGEEAFVKWNATDSIYGARHLAKKWEEEDQLKKIDLMVLLDLLGTAEPRFYNYFPNTEEEYYHMVDIESRLGAAGALVEHAHNSANLKKRHDGYFQPFSLRMGIEDDHIPFLRRHVPILHLIPTPFPEVWHTSSDNLRALDFAAITNLNKMIGIFLMEYLHIGSAKTGDILNGTTLH